MSKVHAHLRIWIPALVALAVAPAADGQTLTVVPLGRAEPVGIQADSPVRSGADYATQVLGDPWDFEQASDHVYMFSEVDGDVTRSSWASVPTVSGGHLVGVPRVARPRLQMLFEGAEGALNGVGRNGYRFPIDSSSTAGSPSGSSAATCLRTARKR